MRVFLGNSQLETVNCLLSMHLRPTRCAVESSRHTMRDRTVPVTTATFCLRSSLEEVLHDTRDSRSHLRLRPVSCFHCVGLTPDGCEFATCGLGSQAGPRI